MPGEPNPGGSRKGVQVLYNFRLSKFGLGKYFTLSPCSEKHTARTFSFAPSITAFHNLQRKPDVKLIPTTHDHGLQELAHNFVRDKPQLK